MTNILNMLILSIVVPVHICNQISYLPFITARPSLGTIHNYVHTFIKVSFVFDPLAFQAEGVLSLRLSVGP